MGVYLGNSVYNESEVTPEWVNDEIEKNGKGVFFATCGVTTFNDILQEYNNGKIIVCKYEPETPGAVTTYYFNLVRFNTETFDFVGVMRDGTIYRTGLNVNEGWEQVANFKLDEIEFVEYNIDSYSTIKSHYDNGKFIVLKYRQQTPLVTKYCFYPLVSVDETNKEIVFGSLELGLNNKKVTFTVTDSGGWAAPAKMAAVVVDSALDPSSHNPVENMAIADELTAINNKITGDLNDIFLALASKGVTVPAGAGLDDVAGLIGDIPAGGGGDLPTGWKKLMWIDLESGFTTSDNRRYLDTDKVTLYCDYENTNVQLNGNPMPFEGQFIQVQIQLGSTNWRYFTQLGSYTANFSSDYSYPTPNLNKVVMDNGNLYINDSLIMSFTPGGGGFICQQLMGATGNYFVKRRFYYCEIERNGKVIARYVPCINANNLITVIDELFNSVVGSVDNARASAGPIIS